MTRFAIGSILFLSALVSCGDRTFEKIPILALSGQKTEPDELFHDSIQIRAGLFYRQLSEKGYQQIYGYARLEPAQPTTGNHNYDLVFLSGQMDSLRERLICSIDPNYHSVIDVITYLPHRYRMISLQQSSMASTFTDIKLLDISVLTRRPDTLLVQANMDGILEKIPLCCEF
jgi:hypothetical protein